MDTDRSVGVGGGKKHKKKSVLMKEDPSVLTDVQLVRVIIFCWT